MKQFSIIIVLVLAGAWAYTSWYWYTCNVRWICDMWNIENEDMLVANSTDFTGTGEDMWNIQDISNAPKLSSEDVLSGSQIKNDSTAQEITEKEALEATNNNENLIKADIVEVEELISSEKEDEATSWICDGKFVGPIAFGGTNNKVQVEILEKFLISQWESVSVDGEYGSADFEAVKRFQLKYRSDILDPWEIVQPTGYVYTTTVKKMIALSCQ